MNRTGRTNWTLKQQIEDKYGTQADFALEIGIHETAVSAIVRGRRPISDEDKKNWAKKLKSTVKIIWPEDK